MAGNPEVRTAPGPGDAGAPRPATPPGSDGVALPRWSSECLLCGQREIAIDHNGTIYRLRATRQGKLILTK